MAKPKTCFMFGKTYGSSFHAQKWLSLDPCGIVGVSCSWAVHMYALIVIATNLLSNSIFATLIYFGIYIPIALLAMASLYKAWTTDPGVVPLGARPLTIVRRSASDLSANSNGEVPAPPRRALRRCHKCNDNYKPPRAHHDSVTGRCVVKFDHFCPWVGNAVGALNHKFFCLFLLYTACTCLISLLLLGSRAVHCSFIVDAEEASNPDELLPDGTNRSLAEYKYPECNNFFSSNAVLGLFVCSLIFLIFTCSMGCEQIEAIETGKGKIARMKMNVGNNGTQFSTVTEEFNEMFGGDSPKAQLHWFLPLTIRFPGSMKKVVLGYEWDESFDPEPYEPDDGNLGDQEMQELENGERTARSDAAAAPPPARDVLLNRDSEGSLNDTASVHSESSGAMGINRRSPVAVRPIE